MMHAQLNTRWFLSAFSAQRINTPWQPWRDGALPPPPHSPPRAHFTLILLHSWLSRAKLCCFSAKSDRCDNRARRSDGPRRCNCASMNFNTFARWLFLRLPRSYRVAQKSDPIARFSGPDRRKSRKINGFYRVSRRRDTIEPTKKVANVLTVRLLILYFLSMPERRMVSCPDFER